MSYNKFEYAKNIIKDILTEEANMNFVSDAIKKRYEVEINYNADELPKGKGKRIIQPVTLGHSKSGNLVVRAFQPYGDTETKTPHWKLFRLDRIDNWKPLKKRHFSEPPDAQYNAEGKYNENGDKTMSDVLVQADFSGSNAYRNGEGRFGNLKKANDERARVKRESNPYYGLEKNIKKSYNANNIDYVRKNIEDWQRSQASKEFKRGNNQSAKDMEQANNFGGEHVSQTVGPITKNNVDASRQAQGREKINQTQAFKNGPKYKTQNIEDFEEDNNVEQEQNK